MRYRRDFPRHLDQRDHAESIQHMVEHVYSVIDSNDDPEAASRRFGSVHVEIFDHFDGDENFYTVIAEIDAEPDAPYLRDDFDPEADSSGIVFEPFEQPNFGRFADRAALARFREEAL